MSREKQLECKGGCKKHYIDMIVLGCDKCMKKVSYSISLEQEKKIAKILKE